MERLALPADDPRIGRHRSCEVYLVCERQGGKAWLERSYDGCCHTSIEEDRRIASMDSKQINDHPNNEPNKISHPVTASPDSRSTASQIEFTTGTAIFGSRGKSGLCP